MRFPEMALYPCTTEEAKRWFASSRSARTYLEWMRWPDSVARCPTCGERVHRVGVGRWRCYNGCHGVRSFSVLAGTAFEEARNPTEALLRAWEVAGRSRQTPREQGRRGTRDECEQGSRFYDLVCEAARRE